MMNLTRLWCATVFITLSITTVFHFIYLTHMAERNWEITRQNVDRHEGIIKDMLGTLMTWDNATFYPSYFWTDTMYTLTRRLGNDARKTAKKLSAYANTKASDNLQPWELAHRNISQFALYDPDDANIDIMLHDIATLPIVAIAHDYRGKQLALLVTFRNRDQALLKPMSYPQKIETNENIYIYDDVERHFADIAAFHLDRILGFYRVPPTIGRRINISSQLIPFAPMLINRTMHTSPAGNLCFCRICYSCSYAHAFCGHPDMIEVSLQSNLPPKASVVRNSWQQPWRRSYRADEKAYWELNDDMCESVRNKPPFNNGKLLLDLIDVHTFDFLTGNKNRHSIATFSEFHNYTFPIVVDNGKGFGRQTYDAMSILAPLRQCCLIRKSTLLKYIKLYIGPERLGSLMEKALESDPIAPVLLRGHLNSLERRLIKILQAVALCIETHQVDTVVSSDKF